MSAIKNSSSDGRTAAKTLLDHLVLKVEQHFDYLPGVVSIMGRETLLADIVQKINSCSELQQPSPPSKYFFFFMTLMHVVTG